MRVFEKFCSWTNAIVIFAFVSFPTSAATINVTTTSDTIAADGVTSLREAFIEANTNGTNDTIVLAVTTSYVLTDCVSGPLSHDESASITVEGNGASIQQTCTDEPILVKTDMTDEIAELRDLTLISASNSGGLVQGATIDAKSQLFLNNVTIDGADAGGGSAVNIDFGSSTINLTLNNSSITNTVGSAITSSNPVGVEIIDSTLSDNLGNGMGLTDGTPTIITNSFIERNSSSGVVVSGQGFGQQPEVTITNSVISDNGDAGFYCLSSCRTLVVENSTISGNGLNLSSQRGGGVTMPIVLQGGTLPSVTITNSTLSGNRADHPGGAVFVFGSFDSSGMQQPTIEIVDSMFDDNAPTCANCDGGALYVSVGSLTVENSDFTNNQAPGDGGAIAISRGDEQVIDEASSFSIDESLLSGNSSGDTGGAISSQVNTALIENTTFSNNSATNDGGALSAGGVLNETLLISGQTSVIGSTFNNNTAFDGGAVFLSFPDGSRVDAINSTIHDNTATNFGGGFYVGTTEIVDLTHVTVSANTASVGANIAASGQVIYRQSIFDEPLGGGDNCRTIPGAPLFVIPNFVSDGFNVISDTTCQSTASDITGPTADPQLGPLVDNGGPTFTRIPSVTGDAAGLVPSINCPTTTDQTGQSRPLGFGCEAGAVEIDDAIPELPTGFPGGFTGNVFNLYGNANDELFRISEYSALADRVEYDADINDLTNPIMTGFIDRSSFKHLRVRSRGGHDEIRILGLNLEGRVDIRSGRGEDTVQVFTSNLGKLDVGLGRDDDRFTFSGGVISGRAHINAGSGSDVLTLAELNVTQRTNVSLGRGNDEFRTFFSTFHRFILTGNRGSDGVQLNDSQFGATILHGGSGVDTLSTPGSVFSSQIIKSF